MFLDLSNGPSGKLISFRKRKDIEANQEALEKPIEHLKKKQQRQLCASSPIAFPHCRPQNRGH
jgi:hypothetical protein